MRKINKLILILLSLVIVTVVTPVIANAAKTSGTCGENVTWSYDNETKTLTISGAGDMYDYELVGYEPNTPWRWLDLDSVILENGVTNVGDYAFCDSGIKNVFLGDAVCDLGYASVYPCVCLDNITVDENNLCYSSENGVLFSKDKKTLVIYPTGRAMESYVIPDGVTKIDDFAFYACDILTKVDFPDSLTTIGSHAFAGCDRLEEIMLPEGLTTICDNAFWHCEFQKLTLPDSLITIGDYAFYSCSNLKEVNLGDGTEIIGDEAFYECDKNLVVTLRHNIKSKVTKAFDVWEPIQLYYSGTKEQWESIYFPPFLPRAKIFYNHHTHRSDFEIIEPTCTTKGLTRQVCKYCEDVLECFETEPTGHKYTDTIFEATCTQHGYTKHTCEACGHYYNDYTANPTGHKINADGVCENCGKTEVVNTTASNNQLLSFDSILQLIMNLISKMFDAILVM